MGKGGILKSKSRGAVMKALTIVFSFVLLTSFSLQSAQAQKRPKAPPRKKAPVLKATKQTSAGITQLMGKFKWGMSDQKVLDLLVKNVRNEWEPDIKQTREPMEQDKKRRELVEKLEQVKKSNVAFTGKTTPWDVSLVDKEFAHKNNESMVVSWEKKERRFYFFHNNKLWKLFIAFNAELFAGKTCEDFAQAMERRFGKAERKFSATLTGDSKMDHLAWPPSEGTLMLAYDLTEFYGNFCLVLIDVKESEMVTAGRKTNSPAREYRDPIVDAVTADPNSNVDVNEDIVDKITGKGARAPNISDSEPPPSVPAKGPAKGTKAGTSKDTGKKKENKNNPLEGLDL
jgi:hypothetical protein